MNTKALLFLSLTLYMVFCGLKIKDLRLVDDQGRELLLHGGCVVVKVPPYFPTTDHFDYKWSFSDRDIEVFKEMGMNGVRLGAM